jgi:hypothetical protein
MLKLSAFQQQRKQAVLCLIGKKKQVVDRMAAIVDSKPLRPETLQ